MKIYQVSIRFGQHETYYVHADDVASAARFAINRDDKVAREAEAIADRYRRVTSVVEFCDAEQFVGPPVSFVRPKAAA